MVPNGWFSSKLGDVCQIINGRPFKPHEWRESGLPIIRIQNLNGSTEYNYYDGEFSDKVLIKSGQLLFAWSGSKGTSFGPHIWNGPDGLLNYHTWRMNVKDDVDSEFFFQYLRVITTRIEGKAHGASALVHTQKGEMEKFPIVIPPLPEQRKIAKILSTWDKAISTTEKLIETSKQQKKALMQQLLTGKKRLVNPDTGKAFEEEWEEVKLAGCVSLMRSGLSRKLENDNVGIAVLRSNNVGERYTSNEDLKYWYLDDPQGANVKNYILDEGDILVNFINSLSQIGKTCIYKKTGDLNAIYTTNLLRLKPKIELITGDFLFYLTKTEGYRNAVKSITKPAVNQASFTTKEFGKITFTLPPLEEQQKIASVLTAATKRSSCLKPS